MKKNVLLLGKYAYQFARTFPKSSYDFYNYFYEINYDIEYDVVFIFEEFYEYIKNIKSHIVIFICGEPEWLRPYPMDYLKQFDIVYSTHSYIKHKVSKQILPWHLGLFDNPDFYDFDWFSNKSCFFKNKEICVISSDKAFSEGHKKRLEFSLKCKNEIKNIDFFGRGIKPFNDKIDFMPNYKYNIVIENSCIKDYWTEKLADSFLSECFTFYFGCPNIKDYFPENSYLILDIKDVDKSIETIKFAIENNFYEKYKEDILKSKERVLNEYTIYNELKSISIPKKIRKKSIRTVNQINFCFKNRLISIIKKVLTKIKRISKKNGNK